MGDIKRISKYIYNGKYNIATAILLSVVISVCLSLLLEISFIKTSLLKFTDKIYILVAAAVLLGVVFTWKRANGILRRYRNTVTLNNPDFNFVDSLFVLISSFLVVNAANREFLVNQLPSKIKYCILYNCGIILLWFVSAYFVKLKSVKVVKSIPNKYSLSDEPIQNDEQDLLGRGKFVDNLYREIINIPFNDSYSFGLHGKWGEGKTSIVNLLIKKLESVNKYFVIKFEPWYFSNEEAILMAFYRQVESALNEQYIFPDIKETFIRYVKQVSFGLAQTGLKMDFNTDKESIEQTKTRIQSYIAKTGKKFVIFIDDIDRLQVDEIMLIFKLVRLQANLRNVVFVLCFDDDYVGTILEQRWTTVGTLNDQSVNLLHSRNNNVI